jgi:hypothetical protein
MNNNPENDQLGLDNLEFFENFATEDLLQDPQFDPNANLAPDILAGEKMDLDDEDLPMGGQQKSTEPIAPTSKPELLEDNPIEEDEEEGTAVEADALANEDDEEINYYEAFGKGLLRSGHFDLGQEVNPDEVEWTEESFLEMMSTTVENKAWKQLEEIATEAYGQEGIELVKDLFINKVPVQQYLSKYNEQIALENIDLTNPQNQEAIFREYLSRTGLDAEEVEEQLEYAVKTNKLENFSEKYYVKLLERSRQEREALAEQSAQRQREIQERENTRQESYIKTLEDAIKTGDINGYPINQNEASTLFDYVTSKNYQLPNGQKISEFEFTLAKMRQDDPQKFLAVARLVQSNLDLTPVKKKGVSEETNSIFKELQNKSKKGPKGEPRKETQLFSNFFGR